MGSITEIGDIVSELSDGERDLFNRLYRYYVKVGLLRLSDAVRDWALSRFGDCERQTVVRVTNKITLESTLFNELRSRRPLQYERKKVDVEECIFCKGIIAEDVFGRVEGRYCYTSSNMAKYDYIHSLIIFRDHEPFVCDEERIRDIIEVAMEWFKVANEFDGSARYPIMIWNCLWRAGASVVHGHAQLLISSEPYSIQEFYGRVRDYYRRLYGSEYLEDLYRVHESLGLSFKIGKARVLAYLTPVKEKEFFIISRDVHEIPDAVSSILKFYKGLGVESFNLALILPPLGLKDYVMVRIVDRGPLSIRTCDIGCMELLIRTSVVSSDPFRIAELFRSGAAEI